MFGKLGGASGLPMQFARGMMGGGGPFAQQPMGGGRFRGGSGMSLGGQAMNAAPMMGATSPTMGALGAGMAGMALSDSASKARIKELEGELSRTYAALGGGPATGNVNPQAPDTAALDEAYRKPGSYSYEYKDPSMPGASPGRHAGPMADELKGIPGVVSPGADGMDRVNPERLTLANTSEVAKLRREMDALLGKIESGSANPSGTY